MIIVFGYNSAFSRYRSEAALVPRSGASRSVAWWSRAGRVLQWARRHSVVLNNCGKRTRARSHTHTHRQTQSHSSRSFQYLYARLAYGCRRGGGRWLAFKNKYRRLVDLRLETELHHRRQRVPASANTCGAAQSRQVVVVGTRLTIINYYNNNMYTMIHQRARGYSLFLS